MKVSDILPTLASDQGLPVRGNSHPMIVLYGSRRLRGKVCCSAAFLAKAAACALVCLLSLGSDIHTRMTFRRTAALAIAHLPLKIPRDRDASCRTAIRTLSPAPSTLKA
jgi:hypothetical protein